MIVAASFVVGCALVIFVLPQSGSGGFAARAGEILRDPLQLFDARSPGSRDYGALTMTKMRFASRGGPAPHERVLSVVRDRPTSAPADSFVDQALDPFGDILPPPAELTGQDYALPLGSAPNGLPLGVGSPYAYRLGQSVPGDGVTPGDEDSSASGDSLGTTPSVPEPATWGMMIAGLFLTALAIRRTNASERSSVLHKN